MIFAHKNEGGLSGLGGFPKGFLPNTQQTPSRKKTALQNRRLSLGLDPQSYQVVVVVEKLYVTDRLAL